MGAGCGLAGAAALLYFSGYLSSPTHSRGDLALAAIVGIYPMTFLSVFFNVALAGAAAASFDAGRSEFERRLASPGSGWAGLRSGRCWRLEWASSWSNWPPGSVRLIKGKWGEGITGLAGIGVWTIFALIPVGILVGVGLSVRASDATLGAALIAIAVGAILLVSALSLAAQQVFSVALYRYAGGAPNTGGFAATDLEEPFRRRRRD
jgi:hypothetical protein